VAICLGADLPLVQPGDLLQWLGVLYRLQYLTTSIGGLAACLELATPPSWGSRVRITLVDRFQRIMGINGALFPSLTASSSLPNLYPKLFLPSKYSGHRIGEQVLGFFLSTTLSALIL
jgi:hypothetical protein